MRAKGPDFAPFHAILDLLVDVIVVVFAFDMPRVRCASISV